MSIETVKGTPTDVTRVGVIVTRPIEGPWSLGTTVVASIKDRKPMSVKDATELETVAQSQEETIDVWEHEHPKGLTFMHDGRTCELLTSFTDCYGIQTVGYIDVDHPRGVRWMDGGRFVSTVE